MLEIKENVSLSEFTTFHIGGPAKYFAVVSDLKELQEALVFTQKNKLDFFILGGGSNILVSDSGYAGLAIKLGNSNIKKRNNVMEVGAGTPLSKAMGTLWEQGYSDWNGPPGYRVLSAARYIITPALMAAKCRRASRK